MGKFVDAIDWGASDYYKKSLKHKSKSKKVYFSHVGTRFKERFDIILTKADVRYMLRQIREGKAALLKDKLYRKRTMWEVTLRDHKFVVIYDQVTKVIVTVYPEGVEELVNENK